MNKPKVLVLSQQPGIGGAERLALAAFSRMTEIHSIVAGPPVQCDFAGTLGLDARILDLPRVRTPLVGPFRLAGHSLGVARLARQEGAQLLFANAIRAMGYGLGARLAGGPPVVIHNHHLLAKGDVTLIDRGLLSRRTLVWSMLRFSSVIVAPSTAAARAFDGSSKVRVVPNGVDADHFVPPAEKASAKVALGLPPDAPVVGTVTRADPEKGMSSFVSMAAELAQRLPGVRFLLGGGPSFPHEITHYEHIKRRASGLGDRIVLTGVLEDPSPLYQAMDVMVHLSELPETFGLTVAEAMACGVPVVGYRWGGVQDVIDDGVTGRLVKPLDIPDVSESVLEVLTDPGTLDEMSRAARSRVLEHFTIDRFAAELESILLTEITKT